YRARRSAVSAVMARWPRTISLIRRGGTPVSLARRYWLRPSGARNSSCRISPGWIGGNFGRGMGIPSMVVGDLDIVGLAVRPSEAEAPLVVDADAVLPFTVASQLLQPVARRHAQVFQHFGGVQEQQL